MTIPNLSITIGRTAMIDDEKLIERGGRRLTRSEVDALRAGIPTLPVALVELLEHHPLTGAALYLVEEADLSAFGVAMCWMTPAHMIREAKDSYPGIAALPLGYVPIGDCSLGSGDPYFYRASDGAVVRIPHDATNFSDADASLDESAVELVAKSVEALVAAASLDDRKPDVDELLN